MTSALEEAQKAGVIIVYVDSPADFPGVATFATDNKAAGKTAEEQMLKALEDAGVRQGKIGIVNVNASTASVVAREEGFRTQGCVGIFGTNEGSTVGTGNAIKEAGKKVIGVGFDKYDAITLLAVELIYVR